VKKYAVVAIVSIVVAVLFYQAFSMFRQRRNLEKQVMELNNQLIEKDVIVVVDSTNYQKATQIVDKIKSDNSTLERNISKQKQKIKYQTKIIAQLSDSIIKIETKEKPNYPNVRGFKFRRSGFYLDGEVNIQDFGIKLNRLEAEFNLEIDFVQNKNGTWYTQVDTKNPNLIVKNISSKVVPYKPKWYEAINYGLGFNVDKIDADFFGFLGYKNYNLSVGYGTNGTNVGFIYLWSF